MFQSKFAITYVHDGIVEQIGTFTCTDSIELNKRIYTNREEVKK